tara:strand:- start:9012 stop:9689 length:678 start_codon:yes stop_codon:yes gene_type:complete
VDSVDKFSYAPHDIFIFNNNPDAVRCVNKSPRWREMSCFGKNMGHGFGLNVGVHEAKGEYILVLDIDCHLLIEGWEKMFLFKARHFHRDADVVAAPGPPEKPLRPACMFLKREIARQYDYSPTPNYRGHRVTPDGYDVAIKAYHKMVADGLTFEWMESFPNRYGTATGEEWGLDGKPIVYHHWHGTHTNEPDRMKDFPDTDLEAEKEKLFAIIRDKGLGLSTPHV